MNEYVPMKPDPLDKAGSILHLQRYFASNARLPTDPLPLASGVAEMLLDPAEVEIFDQKILGQGSSGVVVKGKFRVSYLKL